MVVQVRHRHYRTAASVWRWLLCCTLAGLGAAPWASAQTSQFEEIVVNFDVPKLVSKDLMVRFDGANLYFPLVEAFDLLNINIQADFKSGGARGFLASTDVPYELNFARHVATVKGRELPLLPSDFIIADREFYLKLDLFETLFNLKMTFDFGALRVLLPLHEEFPAYQKLKRQRAREKLQSSVEALRNVRSVAPRHEYFSGGAADWVLSTNPIGGNGQYFDLILGSMILGGDLTLAGSGNTVTGVNPDQFSYRWHYFVRDNPYLTQVELGNVFPVGPLSRSLEGLMVTNRPQIQRKYFQTITLSGHLQPGWEVELYVDNRLVDFAKVDQNGEYSFNLDIMYGASLVSLKKYGPNGEIETEDQYVRVPYNLVPKGSIEYSAAGGSAQIQKGETARYAQATGYYGLTRFLTIGASADLPVASKLGEKPLVAAEATCQVTGSLTTTASFSPTNQSQVNVNYSMPSFLSANLSFTKFEENRYRNLLNQKENATLSVSTPLRLGKKYIGLRYYAAMDRFAGFTSTSMNFGFNTTMRPIYFNYTGKYKLSSYPDRKFQSIASQMLLSAEVTPWFRPQLRVDYDHDQKQITQYGLYLTRRLFRTAQVSLAFERFPVAKTTSIMVNVNFFNQFAYFTSRFLRSDRHTSMSQVQRGSIRYDRVNGTVRLDRRGAVGFGSAVVRPFVDKNNDGFRNKGEELLPGMKAKLNGAAGRAIGENRLFSYDGLRAYDKYTIQVDATSLDNPLLKPAYENFRVSATPNVVTPIDVPVLVASDISGTVLRQTNEGQFGVGGIKIKLLNLSKDIATEIATFNNGEFYYLGLIPGSYRAYIDPELLQKHGYRSQPESIPFEIKAGEKGESIESINFILLPAE